MLQTGNTAYWQCCTLAILHTGNAANWQCCTLAMLQTDNAAQMALKCTNTPTHHFTSCCEVQTQIWVTLSWDSPLSILWRCCIEYFQKCTFTTLPLIVTHMEWGGGPGRCRDDYGSKHPWQCPVLGKRRVAYLAANIDILWGIFLCDICQIWELRRLLTLALNRYLRYFLMNIPLWYLSYPGRRDIPLHWIDVPALKSPKNEWYQNSSYKITFLILLMSGDALNPACSLP